MKQLREQISDVDRSLIEAINRRLKLVAQLKRYKDDQGIAFVDPEREEWMFAYQSRANRGPLSDEGLRAFYTELLALTKREVT
ncbi:MAG TPA: chorismate mutase [Casimicrobiaceae bacterium]|nr:chorismate mutase [Casimicrobiaceae bacterium]